jgi:O-antigen/teichoic acid export membrane protein
MQEPIQAGANGSAGLRQRVLQAGGWVTAGFLLDKLIAAAQMMVVARLLTPADFGLMAASAAVLLAATTLAELGIEPALVARREIRPGDLPVAWTLALGRSVVLTAVLWVLAEPIAAFFRFPELVALLRVHTLALLIQGAQSPAIALLLRNLDMGRKVRLDLIRRLIEAVATIALAWWLRSVWALLWGQLIGFAVGSVLSFRMAPFMPRLSLDRESLGYFAQYGKHLNLTTILIFGVTTAGEFVVGRMLGAGSLGIYQIALTIPVLISTRPVVLISQVSFPTYAILQRARGGTGRAFALQLAVMGLILVPVSTALALLAPELVRILFGAKWLEAAEPLRVLSLYAVCAGLSGVMGSLHYGMNRPEIQTRIWSVQFVVYAGGIVPLTAWLGVVGAAAALTLSFGVGFLLQAFYTLQLLGSEARTAFATLGRTTLPVIAIGAGLAGLGKLPIEQSSIWPLLLAALAAGTAYVVYLWRMEFPRLVGLWRGE